MRAPERENVLRAVEIAGDRSLRLVELPEEPLLPGQLRVTVRLCGICGSDLHMREMPEIAAGVVMGHEFMGVVSELGPDAEGWRVGERVVANPLAPCGDCRLCRAGRGQLCPAAIPGGIGLGSKRGAYAESVVVGQERLFRLPDSVGDADGAMVEPLAVAVHGVRLAQVSPADTCVVMGAGPVGILTACVLRAAKVEPVAVVDPTDARRRLAAALGFPVAETIDGPGGAALLTDGADVVFDCTGHPSAIESAMPVLRAGGRVVMLGVPMASSSVHLGLVAALEIEIRGSLGYTDDDFATAIGYLASGTVSVGHLVTTVDDLDRADYWFGELASGRTDQVKVLLRP
jgi:(R,R)-butanediol dehydrogenase / meso-butanediol dehydrogenase / diacetyl reductase